MRNNPALLVFSTVFGIAYTFFFENTWALFRFYPAYNQFSFTALGPEAGPAILWYGWLANAFLVSAVAALIVPRALAAKLSPGIVSGSAVVMLVVIAFLLRTWFI